MKKGILKGGVLYALLAVAPMVMPMTGCAYMESYLPPKPKTVAQARVDAELALNSAYQALVTAAETNKFSAAQIQGMKGKLDAAESFLVSAEKLIEAGKPADAQSQIDAALKAINATNAAMKDVGGGA